MKKVVKIFLGILTAAAGLSSAQAACNIDGTTSGIFALQSAVPPIDAAADLPDGTVLFSTR
jgi:hypothetical protein